MRLLNRRHCSIFWTPVWNLKSRKPLTVVSKQEIIFHSRYGLENIISPSFCYAFLPPLFVHTAEKLKAVQVPGKSLW